MKRKVLLIYTGGTIGMVKDHVADTLKPFDFDHIQNQVPELSALSVHLDIINTGQAIDSSDMKRDHWIHLASMIEEHYESYDGFVILHGTDTMAYTASALSFLLENLDKPVILTGSQLPIGTLRTDGKENLITAIEIASTYENDRPVVPEVAIYFEYGLFRGNRSIKVDAEHFKAFESPNYGMLAVAGVNLKFKKHNILPGNPNSELTLSKSMDNRVGLIKIFPEMPDEFMKKVCELEGQRALVLESFGSGNFMNDPVKLEVIKDAINRGLIVLNISQCIGGSVLQGRYQNSRILNEIGVISGEDMTTAAGLIKLMYLLGKYDDRDEIINKLGKSLRGELTESV